MITFSSSSPDPMGAVDLGSERLRRLAGPFDSIARKSDMSLIPLTIVSGVIPCSAL